MRLADSQKRGSEGRAEKHEVAEKNSTVSGEAVVEGTRTPMQLKGATLLHRL